ncbi:MAG: ABC transporter ATP-binding protein [Chloroflexi bacterium]|nr:ABC transporter ATP-binding protein [Chloroflexota bacterium]
MSVICLQNVSKKFVIHHDRPRSFQELLIRTLGRNHNHSREEFWVLRDLDLEVEQGETLGIIGSNGAGKSTLLKLIAGIIQPTTGKITVKGRLAALLELGAGFHPDLTGRENVFLSGSILGLTAHEMRSRFDEIVSFAELEKFIDMPLRYYSSGMQVRLGFSIAACLDPDILLIDEVLAVGDEAFQKKCLARIDEFCRSGKTILLVSHNLEAVKQLCSRVLWLETNQPAVEGPAVEMVEKYRLHVWEEEAKKRAHDASAHGSVDQDTQSVSKTRWGSGEIIVSDVRLINRAGVPVHWIQCGDPLTIEIHYHVQRAVPDVVFGIAIYRSDGLWCYGTNTEIDAVDLGPLADDGVVCVDFPSLGLIAGEYSLDVALHDSDGHAYDYWHPYCAFSVRSHIQDVGVYRPAHQWRIGERRAGDAKEGKARA